MLLKLRRSQPAHTRESTHYLLYYTEVRGAIKLYCCYYALLDVCNKLLPLVRRPDLEIGTPSGSVSLLNNNKPLF